MQRIVTNTAVLFARQIILALIALYTVRLLLQNLGISDYAVLIAALSVAMLLSFVTSSIGMITQRYLAFALGTGAREDARRYYDSCLFITIMGALSIFVLLETAGLWFVSRHMVIAPERYDAVIVLFQMLVLQTAASTLTIFSASVILAREDMHVFALFSIVEALLRLSAALSIAFIPMDSLVAYGGLLVVTGLVVMVSQWAYCMLRYEECSPRRVRIDIATLREMISFVRWTLFGQFTTVCRTQAITLLINQAFNPATVAARALSFTIYSQVLTFSQNFLSALNPPITKAYASGDRTQTFSLIFFGSRVAFFLSWIVTLPLIALLPGILELWLGVYPDETVLFTRLALVEGLILSISFPLMTAIRAVGDMRAYELMLGGLQILVLVFSWLLVREGFPAYSVFIVAILINIVMFFVRLWLAKRLLGLNVTAYARSVVLPVGVTAAVSVAVVIALITFIPGSAVLEMSFISLAAASAILLSAPICVYAVGLSGGERVALHTMIRTKFRRAK